MLLCYNKTQGVEGMFKRMTTSLTKPPLAVFFMKDSWIRAILYLFFIPLFLTIPLVIRASVNPGMPISRYEAMVDVISKDIIGTNAQIEAGTLTYQDTKSASFDYFTLYLGTQTISRESIGFVFRTHSFQMYVSGVIFSEMTYEAIGLSSFDFSDTSIQNVRLLASGIKQFYDQETTIIYMDIMLTYFLGVFDYVFYVFFSAFLMMIFFSRVQIPFRYRLKLSIYLTTIYVFASLVFTLFKSPQLEFFSVALISIYHIWAYRSMKIIKRGDTL